MSKAWRSVTLALAAGLMVLSGCAPLNASTAIREAEAHMDKARAAGADKAAPYEYFLARAYLIKAKRTEGYSEFGIAEQYGLQAKDYALKAMSEARENLLRQKILNERLQKKNHQGGRP